MKYEFDINNWKRKEHFEFFADFEEPFFGITVDLHCEKAYNYCKDNHIPFYAFYLYCSNKAVNEIENFRLRIENGKVWKYDKINISATMARPDETFGFSYVEHDENFTVFLENFQKEKEVVMKSKKLFSERMDDETVHYTSLPWIAFTSMSHSRKFSREDSCPKISFGKLSKDKSFTMPVAIHVHHALADAYHVSQLIDKLQWNLYNPEHIAGK